MSLAKIVDVSDDEVVEYRRLPRRLLVRYSSIARVRVENVIGIISIPLHPRRHFDGSSMNIFLSLRSLKWRSQGNILALR